MPPTKFPRLAMQIPSKRVFNRRLWPLLGLTLLGAAGSVVLLSTAIRSDGLGGAEDTALSSGRALPVSVVSLETASRYEATREYTGEVQAARVSELGFETGGRIVQMLVQSGQSVSAGQLIASQETSDLESQIDQLTAQKAEAMAVLSELENGPRQEEIAIAQAEMAAIQDELALERERLARRESLYRQGAISREELDEVSFGQAALSDRLVAAQNRLAELQAGTRPEQIDAQRAVVRQLEAEVANLDIEMGKRAIYAPYAGVIGDRLMDEGTVASEGQAVVSLVESTALEADIGVPEGAIAHLSVGNTYQLTIANQSYPAQLVAINPELSPSTRTRTVTFQLPETATVSPQQIAQLQLSEQVRAQGYWVPVSALIKGERGLWGVYSVVSPESAEADETDAFEGEPQINEPQINEPQIVERQDVEVLYTEAERAFVRGTVQAGDLIVASGVQRIVPGQSVEVKQ